MEVSIYSIKDEVANLFLPLFTMNSDAEAVRMFADCVNAPNHVFGKNPSDYILYQIAEYNNSTGVIQPLESFSKLAAGLDLVRPETPLDQSLPF